MQKVSHKVDRRTHGLSSEDRRWFRDPQASRAEKGIKAHAVELASGPSSGLEGNVPSVEEVFGDGGRERTFEFYCPAIAVATNVLCPTCSSRHSSLSRQASMLPLQSIYCGRRGIMIGPSAP